MMNIDSGKYIENSLDLIEYVFEQNDIYLVDSLNVYNLVNREGTYKSPRKLSLAWLYDRTGFLNTLGTYDTFAKRATEFMLTGDYIKSFRQRLAMIHEMISCNFSPNLPLHISIQPRDTALKNSDSLEFDIENTDIGELFNIQIHPGQTRAQSSIFLRNRINNNLIYVKKDYRDSFSFKPYSNVKKIESIEELLKVYKPSFSVFSKSDYENYDSSLQFVYNFALYNKIHPEGKPLKYHNQTNTTIIKCVDMGLYNRETNKIEKSFHSTLHYIPDTFTWMNRFCEIVFNSPLKLYTDNQEKAYRDHGVGLNYLLFGEVISKPEMRNHPFSEVRGTFINESAERPPVYPTLEVKMVEYLKKNLPTDQYNELMFLDRAFSTIKSPTFFNFTFNYEEVDYNMLSNYNKLVEKNLYRGYCISYNCNQTEFYRSIYEVLLLCPSNFSLARSENNNIAVINCEHPYWKTGEGYKEFVFSDSFMELKCK